MKRILIPLSAVICAFAVIAEVPRVFPKGQQPDDVRLKPLKDLNGHFPFAVPKTLKAWEARKAELRRRVAVANGLFPMPPKTPLNAVIHGKVHREGFSAEKVYFESLPGFYVTGILFRPTAKIEGKWPAVLCPHGHGGRLQMLKVKGVDNAHLEAHQEQGATYDVEWVDIDEPDATYDYTPGEPAPTGQSTALTHVASQGWARGAAYFSRLEGQVHDRGTYFTSTQGGGAAMQFASMQIELSDDGDAILGSGADGLGSFELQRGRRAVDVRFGRRESLLRRGGGAHGALRGLPRALGALALLQGRGSATIVRPRRAGSSRRLRGWLGLLPPCGRHELLLLDFALLAREALKRVLVEAVAADLAALGLVKPLRHVRRQRRARAHHRCGEDGAGRSRACSQLVCRKPSV